MSNDKTVYTLNTSCYTAGKNKGGMMSTVKTAISLEKPLLEQVDSVAQEMGIPRSRLFVIAMETFLEQRQNRQLVEAINQVYTEHPPTPQEETYLKEMQSLYGSGLEDEGW
ncbi:MAG: CopG family transcriptional regulator [Chloroflexota bacterium]